MSEFFLDIETIPLPVAQREFLRPNAAEVPLGNTKDPAKVQAKVEEALASWERGDDAALDPLQARVALIGYAQDDGPVKHIVGEDEAEMLRAFWAIVDKSYRLDASLRIVGHCVRFDAGMLVKRSWINRVMVPPVLLLDLYNFAPRHWIDTATRWQLGDRRETFRKLKHLCGAFGIPAKDSPVSGADFASWWTADRAACIAYNTQDVEAVRALWAYIGGDFQQPFSRQNAGD